MQANEVRIGNYVSLSGEKKLKVNEIYRSGFYAADEKSVSFKNTWSEIEPIPLTEEWLVNFKLRQSMELTNYWTEDEEMNVFIDSEGIHYSIMLNNDGDFLKIKKLEYVHQLQNLYFSLTGKDLSLIYRDFKKITNE